ncbi:MAG: glycosyltransferase [Phenylobacterium sp.]|nr:MAG: glycosyltransferase [Phenylobacterium sp.]
MRQTVVSSWPLSSFHGWGVYGLNLALNWAEDPDVALVCAMEVDPSLLALDAASLERLRPMREASANLVRKLAPFAGIQVEVPVPVLLAMDRHLLAVRSANRVVVSGSKNLGVVFLESAGLSPEAVARAERMDLILAGSSWNEALLRTAGVTRVRTVLQGVDPAIFHPGPRLGRLEGRPAGDPDIRDRFLVFSGGKPERRKAQDLVLAAFRIFAQRHPDALLVAAWGSHWPEAARTLDQSGVAPSVVFAPDGQLNAAGWACATGVAADQVLDLGLTPNAKMPALLREMDVALFPNRCEGGTNLVAMEAMACGVPTILSANTGHLDLIAPGNSYPLTRQSALDGEEAGAGDVPGWGESDVDEIVAALEAAYADRDEARRRGLAGAETLSRMTWAHTAAAVKDAVLSLG